MYKSEVVKALGEYIEPINITLYEVLETKVKHIEKIDLSMMIAMYNLEKEAMALMPYYHNELMLRERRLDKNYVMWNSEEVAEFDYYFANKYINNRNLKGAI